MIPAKKLPSLEYLMELFTLEKGTGVLRWNRRPLSHFIDDRACKVWNTRYAGTPAGTKNPREITLCIDGEKFRAHRVIFFIHYGFEPPFEIDHQDGDPQNNRLENLRPATRLQNQKNTKINCRNALRLKGVSIDKRCGKFVAQIASDGKRLTIGRFNSAQEAHAAYAVAAKQLHGEFARIS